MPTPGNLRQDMNARANVFTSFCVVCRGGIDSLGPISPAVVVEAMKSFQPKYLLRPERVTPSFMQGDQRGMRVEGGILKSLGRHCPGEHLPAKHKVQPFLGP